MVLHQGDFDYQDNPDAWDQKINDILGPDFPYFASIGNHDVAAWSGYQQKLQERLARLEEANCTGDLGVESACTYRGLFFLQFPGAGAPARVRARRPSAACGQALHSRSAVPDERRGCGKP